MAVKTLGINAVDWEQRVDFDRLSRSGSHGLTASSTRAISVAADL